MLETPTDVAAFLAKRQISRARAKRKLADVLSRAATGTPPLDRIREIWAFGSFARGASKVGDIDLYMLVDEPRTPDQFGLDTYYARAQPFSAQIKALGCGGSSLVSVQAQPVFGAAGEPASPERLALMAAARRSIDNLFPVVKPVIHHIVTDESLAGPFVLLWARGDDEQWPMERLDAIHENPHAARYERTTTIPLIDDLAPKLGLETAFMLALQLRKGNIACRALLLQPAEPPEKAKQALERRYRSPGQADLSPRAAVAGAALSRLTDEGVNLRHVELVDGPVTTNPGEVKIAVSFNPFFLYLAASGSYRSAHRLLHVWPSGAHGPWLAFEVTVVDAEGAANLSHSLSSFDSTRADRAAAILKILNSDA